MGDATNIAKKCRIRERSVPLYCAGAPMPVVQVENRLVCNNIFIEQKRQFSGPFKDGIHLAKAFYHTLDALCVSCLLRVEGCRAEPMDSSADVESKGMPFAREGEIPIR
jgi:hypothetical protein